MTNEQWNKKLIGSLIIGAVAGATALVLYPALKETGLFKDPVGKKTETFLGNKAGIQGVKTQYPTSHQRSPQPE